MIEALKRIYWDISKKSGRLFLLEHFLRNLPSGFGMYVRERYYSKRFLAAGKKMDILPGTYIIHPEKIECGDYFKIGINNYIQAGGGLRCGDHVMLGPYAKIWTQNHIITNPDMPIWQQGYEKKRVEIGNDVWIGASAFIMPGAIIEDGCVISAGSIVGGKRYLAGSILAGNPARKIGQR